MKNPFVLIIFTIGFLLGSWSSCRPVASVGTDMYTLDIVRCVSVAQDLKVAQACKQKTDARWGITEVEAGER